MLAAFFRCLRFFLSNSQVNRESALWWSGRGRPYHGSSGSRAWYGPGFENTLFKHGYCWFEPRFDWNRLQGQSDLGDWIVATRLSYLAERYALLRTTHLGARKQRSCEQALDVTMEEVT